MSVPALADDDTDTFIEECGAQGFVVEKTGSDYVLTKYTGSDTVVEVPRGITVIGGGGTSSDQTKCPFANTNSVTEVILPDTITGIAAYAFYKCTGLTSITFPDGLKSIGNRAFAYAGLVSVEFGGSVPELDIAIFMYDVNLESIEFPVGITRIPDNVVSRCDHLTRVILPESVEYIGGNSFAYCPSLKEITLPPSLQTIYTAPFRASGFESLTIPYSVASVGDQLFYDCSSLKKVTFLTPDTSFTSGSFSNFPSGAKLYCKYGSTTATFADSKKRQYEYISSNASLDVNNGESAYSGIDVYSGYAESYGFKVGAASKIGEVSALDVLLTAHHNIYGDQFTRENYKQYLDVTDEGEVVKAFGTYVANFSFTINGSEVTDSVFDAVVGKGETLAVTYDQADPTCSYWYKGTKIYSQTARPGVKYAITLADGTSPLPDMDVYATGADNAANIFDEANKIGATDVNGAIELKFDKEGSYKVAAKDASGIYDISYLDVTVNSPDLNLKSLSVSGGVSDTYTELKSGYVAGSFVKKGATKDIEGFDPTYYSYEYHVNSDAAEVSFNLEPPTNYDNLNVELQVGDGNREALHSYSEIPVTLTGDTTTAKLCVSYTEDGIPYEQEYTVEIIRSEVTPYLWLLDYEPVEGALKFNNPGLPVSKTANVSLLCDQSAKQVTVRVIIEADNTVTYNGQELTPINTYKALKYSERKGNVYELKLDTSASAQELTVDNGTEKFTGKITLTPRSPYEGVYTPDRVVEYKPAQGQYVFDNTPINTPLRARTSYADFLSLGSFGGYVTFEYDDPITNDPTHPYGVDFIIYGNAFKGGAANEPGGVQVSSDGVRWYDLAGSNHYELEMLKGQTAALKDGTRTTSLKLLSDTFYPKVYFGYADVSSCSIYANADPAYYPEAKPTNPYNNADFQNIGDGFDLSWAVDGSGKPVKVDSVKYIRVQNIMDEYSASLGENSTEIGTVMKVNAKYVDQKVGVTAEPEIRVMNQPLPAPAEALSDGQIKYYEIDLDGKGFPAVTVSGAKNDNIFINTERFVGQGEYVGLPDESRSRTIRVIVQNGEKEPHIYVIKCTNCGDPTENADLTSIKLTPGDTELSQDTGGNYVATLENNVQYITFTVKALNPKATIKLDNTTITHGEATVPLKVDIGANSFTLTITSPNGNTIKTYPITITRKSAETPSNTITVSFTFTGDTIHYITNPTDKHLPGTSTGPHTVLPWIPTTTVTVPKGSTVKYVTDMMLMNAKIGFHTESGTYIDKVQIPGTDKYLGEFDNGPNSGWMYRVNGIISNAGYASKVLNSGDKVLWFYTDDYTKETGYEGPWNPSDSKNDSSSSTISPKVTVSDGVADVKLSESDLTSAIASAKENESSAIIISPEITGVADKVSVELPKSSIASMASETSAALTVQTPVGNITIPNSALTVIASQASGSSVTISLSTVEPSALTETQKSTAAGKTVYNISILSGNSHISSFGDNTITISLPYTLKDGEDPSGVTVWYMDDSGKLQQMTCTYDKTTGMTTFTTTHLSYYVVGYSEVWKNPFTDVKSTDWFYGAVQFAVQKNLFNGTSDTTFGPNDPMTRAMLVTVLYRLEGSPAVTQINSFTDVIDGQWYTSATIWANANKIVTGYGNGLFGTNDNITREQMATILYNYAKYKGYDVAKAVDLKAFTDAAAISNWAQSGMTWANAEGLITGRTTTALAPGGAAARAEVATILQRFVEDFAK